MATQAIFSIEDQHGSQFTLTALENPEQTHNTKIRYWMVLGWNGNSGTAFDISRMRKRFPKHKIDVSKIADVIENDLKGYRIKHYETL